MKDLGEPKEDCWIYAGSLTADGYGRCRAGGRDKLVSHLMLEEKLGRELHPGYCALHTCDYPPCVNPGHLWEGTKAENNYDRAAKGRTTQGDAHWSRRHPEKVKRGDDHNFRVNPACRPYGDRNGSRKHPESRPRGDAHHSKRHPEAVFHGETHHSAVLNPEIVLCMRRLHAAGVKTSTLALAVQVKWAAADRVVRRITWKHVE